MKHLEVATLMAELYFTVESARAVLIRSGFPVHLMPNFPDPQTFWSIAVLQMEQGIGPAGLLPNVIIETARNYQGNARAQALLAANASGDDQRPSVTFNDIGGYQEVKHELQQALQLLSAADGLPDRYADLRTHLVPRGFVFHGEPGTGKAMFAQAMADWMSAVMPRLSALEINGDEGHRKILEVFAEARAKAPAVIVFDDFDTFSPKGGGSRAAMAQLLTEMDGFRMEVPLLVVGIADRLDMVDGRGTPAAEPAPAGSHRAAPPRRSPGDRHGAGPPLPDRRHRAGGALGRRVRGVVW